MDRLTIPDKKIPGGVGRVMIDTKAVRKEAMTLYWKLKKYEDTGLTPEEIYSLRAGTILKMIGAKWIPVEERLPEDDRYILLSFDNFDIPLIGRYETDSDGGGAFYLGDNDEQDTCVSENLFVNAWIPLPEPYRTN